MPGSDDVLQAGSDYLNGFITWEEAQRAAGQAGGSIGTSSDGTLHGYHPESGVLKIAQTGPGARQQGLTLDGKKDLSEKMFGGQSFHFDHGGD